MAGILALHLLRSFLLTLCWITVVLSVFACLATTAALLAAHPYVPFSLLISILPDLTLSVLPVIMTVSVMVAGLIHVRTMLRGQVFLWVQMTGTWPGRVHVPVMLAGLVLSAGVYWLEGWVIPHARYHSRFAPQELTSDVAQTALQFARRPNLLPGMDLYFDSSAGNRLRGLRLSGGPPEGQHAVWAQSAQIAVSGEGAFEMDLRSGRYLSLSASLDPLENARFDRLRARYDARSFTQPAKQNLIHLQYYSTPELSLLSRQSQILWDQGIPPTPRQERRVAAAALMKGVLVKRLSTGSKPGSCEVFGGARRVHRHIIDGLNRSETSPIA